jgi:hypothetical protein
MQDGATGIPVPGAIVILAPEETDGQASRLVNAL